MWRVRWSDDASDDSIVFHTVSVYIRLQNEPKHRKLARASARCLAKRGLSRSCPFFEFSFIDFMVRKQFCSIAIFCLVDVEHLLITTQTSAELKMRIQHNWKISDGISVCQTRAIVCTCREICTTQNFCSANTSSLDSINSWHEYTEKAEKSTPTCWAAPKKKHCVIHSLFDLRCEPENLCVRPADDDAPEWKQK